MSNTSSTSSAHTTGPWTFQELPKQFDNGNLAWQIESEIADFPTIGQVCWRNTDEEGIANARLIAAAPSHDEALRKMVSAIEEMLEDESLQITSDCGDLLLQIATIGNKAIAKAEGKSEAAEFDRGQELYEKNK